MSKKNPNKKEIEEYNKKEKVCKKCGTKYFLSWSKSVLSDFCSKECSRSYSSSIKRKEINQKVSLTLRGKRNKIQQENFDKNFSDYNKNPKFCPICNTKIDYYKRFNKTCSYECGLKLISIKNTGNSNIGGHRDKGGRSKSGYYKGLYCGSTYELVYTIYNLDHNISFERNTIGFPYEFNGKVHHYYPDYKTPDGYVEIKGYWSELVDIKLSAVQEPIKILYEKDLQYAFDYVSKTYLNSRKTRFEELYDSKEDAFKYSYTCDLCQKTFKTNIKRNENKRKFCSNKCYHDFRKLSL